jgi:hypothetical protein
LPADEVLAQATMRDCDIRAYRVALTVNEKEIFDRCIDNQDSQALQEAAEFFPFAESDLQALLDGPFTPKPVSEGKPFREGRFSDGSHAVFYSAQEPETARDEYAHIAPIYFPGSMGTLTFRINLIDCRVLGSLYDLRPLAETFPDLIANDHGFCRDVGASISARGNDGLIAISVRRANGTNAAIFKRDCLSDPRHIGFVMCTVDAVAKRATCQIAE